MNKSFCTLCYYGPQSSRNTLRCILLLQKPKAVQKTLHLRSIRSTEHLWNVKNDRTFLRQLLKMVGGQALGPDGQGHLLGCLEANVAKQVLLGWKVVVVHCEGNNISVNFYRNKLKYLAFLYQWMNTNPSCHRTISEPLASSFGGPREACGPINQARPGCVRPQLLECQVYDGILLLYDKEKQMGPGQVAQLTRALS